MSNNTIPSTLGGNTQPILQYGGRLVLHSESDEDEEESNSNDKRKDISTIRKTKKIENTQASKGKGCGKGLSGSSGKQKKDKGNDSNINKSMTDFWREGRSDDDIQQHLNNEEEMTEEMVDKVMSSTMQNIKNLLRKHAENIKKHRTKERKTKKYGKCTIRTRSCR